MLRHRLALMAALLGALMSGLAGLGFARPAGATELPGQWQVPPGDPLEHAAAGYAKILCSAVFISGRDLATAAAEDGTLFRMTIEYTAGLPNTMAAAGPACVMARSAPAPFTMRPVEVTALLAETESGAEPRTSALAPKDPSPVARSRTVKVVVVLAASGPIAQLVVAPPEQGPAPPDTETTLTGPENVSVAVRSEACGPRLPTVTA